MDATSRSALVVILLAVGLIGCEVVTPSDLPPSGPSVDGADAGMPDAGLPDSGTALDGGAEPPPPAATLEAVVDFVVDGDTLQASASGQTIRIRVWGINTPEVGQPFHGEATQAAGDFLPRGSKVTLGFDDAACAIANAPNRCRDAYDRVLAYAANPAGRDLGAHQLRNGLARIYSRCECSRLSTYTAAEALARTQNLGIWKR